MMTFLDPKSPEIRTQSIWRIVDTVDHLQAVSFISDKDWLDLLQVTEDEYAAFRAGRKCIPFSALTRVAEAFGVSTSALLTGKVDFREFALENEKDKRLELDEKYLRGCHGRMRSIFEVAMAE